MRSDDIFWSGSNFFYVGRDRMSRIFFQLGFEICFLIPRTVVATFLQTNL